MDGVTILAINEIAQYTWGFSWMGAGCITIGILALLFVVVVSDGEDMIFGGICLGVMCLAAMCAFAEGAELPPKVQYKVTIDNTVNFNEFNNKYEIIDQDGLIYTVKEKE